MKEKEYEYETLNLEEDYYAMVFCGYLNENRDKLEITDEELSGYFQNAMFIFFL